MYKMDGEEFRLEVMLLFLSKLLNWKSIQTSSEKFLRDMAFKKTFFARAFSDIDFASQMPKLIYRGPKIDSFCQLPSREKLFWKHWVFEIFMDFATLSKIWTHLAWYLWELWCNDTHLRLSSAQFLLPLCQDLRLLERSAKPPPGYCHWEMWKRGSYRHWLTELFSPQWT